MCADLNLPLLGKLPLDPRIARSCDEGRPFLREVPDSPASEAYRAIVQSKATPILFATLPAAVGGTGGGGALFLMTRLFLRSWWNVRKRRSIPFTDGKWVAFEERRPAYSFLLSPWHVTRENKQDLCTVKGNSRSTDRCFLTFFCSWTDIQTYCFNKQTEQSTTWFTRIQREQRAACGVDVPAETCLDRSPEIKEWHQVAELIWDHCSCWGVCNRKSILSTACLYHYNHCIETMNENQSLCRFYFIFLISVLIWTEGIRKNWV